MNEDTLEDTGNRLCKMFLQPPTPESALKMIGIASRLHISAITGLLVRTVHDQEALDSAYSLAEEASLELLSMITDALEIIAVAHELKYRGEPTTHNQQVADEILEEMESK